MITKENYESWFLDYHEGNLDSSGRDLVQRFLDLHPELKEEFDAFEQISLDTPEVSLPESFVNNLKKKEEITEHSVQEWLIADLEGSLNTSQKHLLEQYLQSHPELENDRKLYSMTVLKPDMNERFQPKAKLYRGKVIFMARTTQYQLAIAAAIMLLLGAWWLLRLNTHETEQQYSDIVKDTNAIQHVPVQQEKINEHTVASTEKKQKNTIANGYALPKTENEKIVNHKKPSPAIHNSRKQMVDETLTATAISPAPLLIPKPIEVEEPFVYPGRRWLFDDTTVAESAKRTLSTEQFFELIKNETASAINQLAGEDLLASSDKPGKLPLKSRLIKFFARTVNRVSGDKIKMKTIFNPLNGELAAYEVEVGKRKLQKQY